MIRKRVLERLVFVAVIGGLIAVTAFLYPAVRAARDASLFPNGPYGELIPSDLPQESMRIRHPSGFSIVPPPNWEIFDRGIVVEIAARHRGGGTRLRSFIAISQSDTAGVTLANWKKITFHGYVAYEHKMHVDREDSFDDPAFSSYSLLVDVSGKWWLIQFGLAKERDSLPPEIAAYINTIRFDDASEPSHPTEAPAGSVPNGE